MIDEREFLKHIKNPRPGLHGKSEVEYECPCGAAVRCTWKQLKHKVRNGKPFRCKSCAIKKLWEDPSFRGKISQEKIWSDVGLRERMSVMSKMLWEDPEYVRKQMDSHRNPEYIERMRLHSSMMWNDEDFRVRQKEMRNHPEWIRKQSESMKSLWEDSGYRERVISSLGRVFVSGFRSSIEVTTGNLLRDLGIDFEEQKALGPYLFDFYIPADDVFIECQGEYWHSISGAASRDSAKFSYLGRARPGSRLLYLHERDFLNPGCIREKIKSFLVNGYSKVCDVREFSFSELSVVRLDAKLKKKRHRSDAQEFLDSYHYAQFGRSSKAVYGTYLDGKLISVCKFSTPVRKEVATSIGYRPSEVLELDRFCIHPTCQRKNFASWMLSRCVGRVFDEFSGVMCLVSFADHTHGHRGTIYMASNWTKHATVPPDYHYVSGDGWILHKKTLYNHASRNGMSESEYATKHGYMKAYGGIKIKFIMRRKMKSSRPVRNPRDFNE